MADELEDKEKEKENALIAKLSRRIKEQRQ
jgi:hypothetical protein